MKAKPEGTNIASSFAENLFLKALMNLAETSEIMKEKRKFVLLKFYIRFQFNMLWIAGDVEERRSAL